MFTCNRCPAEWPPGRGVWVLCITCACSTPARDALCFFALFCFPSPSFFSCLPESPQKRRLGKSCQNQNRDNITLTFCLFLDWAAPDVEMRCPYHNLNCSIPLKTCLCVPSTSPPPLEFASVISHFAAPSQLFLPFYFFFFGRPSVFILVFVVSNRSSTGFVFFWPPPSFSFFFNTFGLSFPFSHCLRSIGSTLYRTNMRFSTLAATAAVLSSVHAVGDVSIGFFGWRVGMALPGFRLLFTLCPLLLLPNGTASSRAVLC